MKYKGEKYISSDVTGKAIASEIDYYYSLMHGGKIDEEYIPLWFPLARMVEAIYCSENIAVSYGLETGRNLLISCCKMFSEKIESITDVKDKVVAADPYINNKINELFTSLRLLILKSEDGKE